MREPYLWNKLTVHPFYRFLDEIDECLDKNILMPALAMTLMIPDICGKVLYPECKIVKFSYAAWYDHMLGLQDINPDNKDITYAEHARYLDDLDRCYTDMAGKGKLKQQNIVNNIVWWPQYSCLKQPCMNGDVLYALRCSFLHSGGAGLDANKHYSFKFTNMFMQIGDIFGPVSFIEFDPNGTIIFHINILKLCKCVLRVALSLFIEAPEKYDFMKFDFSNGVLYAEKLLQNGAIPIISRFSEDSVD